MISQNTDTNIFVFLRHQMSVYNLLLGSLHSLYSGFQKGPNKDHGGWMIKDHPRGSWRSHALLWVDIHKCSGN